MARLFPVLIIALSIGAAIVYGAAGDLRRCIYFLAAAVLNACIVW